MFDFSSLLLASLVAYGAGMLTCFILLVAIGGRAERRNGPARSTGLPPVVLVHHRLDVHHHGLPSDELPGDEWKRGKG